MNRFGVIVKGFLDEAHVWIEGRQVALSYDGKATRQGHVQVQVVPPLLMQWYVSGWNSNPYGIELYELGDIDDDARLIDTVKETLKKGVDTGAREYNA